VERNVDVFAGAIEDVQVMGQRFRLEHALVNLLHNAIRFNRAGGEVRLEAVLVGETASALHARHRFSRDANHVLPSLREQFDEMTGNLVELIQPVLIMGMGIMVGLLFASVLIPIYRLTASFS